MAIARSRMLDLTSDTALRQLEETSSRPFFLAFVDDTLPICRAMSSAYTALNLRFSEQIVLGRAHITQCPEAVTRFRIEVVPMHYLFAGSHILWQKIGGLSTAELVAQIDRALQEHRRAGG